LRPSHSAVCSIKKGVVNHKPPVGTNKKKTKLLLTPLGGLCYSLRPLWDSNLEND
jgi:hypothetical protein